MAYTEEDFPTAKALRAAVESGERITVYQPGGMFPLRPNTSGSAPWVVIEGPQYPKPHRFYVKAEVAFDDDTAQWYITKCPKR
jgi:hypothetical protein